MNKLPNKSSLLCSDSEPTKSIRILNWFLALMLIINLAKIIESYGLAVSHMDIAYKAEQACKDRKACACMDAYWASRAAENNYRRNGRRAEGIKQKAYRRERDCKAQKLNECMNAYWASRRAENKVKAKQFWKTNTIK